MINRNNLRFQTLLKLFLTKNTVSSKERKRKNDKAKKKRKRIKK